MKHRIHFFSLSSPYKWHIMATGTTTLFFDHFFMPLLVVCPDHNPFKSCFMDVGNSIFIKSFQVILKMIFLAASRSMPKSLFILLWTFSCPMFQLALWLWCLFFQLRFIGVSLIWLGNTIYVVLHILALA